MATMALSMTMGSLLVPVMLKPKRLVRMPKLELVVWASGFQRTAGMPALAMKLDQPVVLG